MSCALLIYSGFLSLVCYSAFVVFMFFGNYPASVLALIAGIAENISFFLHWLYAKRELHLWYGPTDLRQICRFGIVMATVGLLNLGYHTTIQILLKKRILPISDSSVIAIIWSLVALKCNIFLMYYCIKYQHSESTTLLDAENIENLDTEPVQSSSSSDFS